jgi:Replication-relaxation
MTMTPASGRLNPTDVLVLRAVNRFRYLMASQLNRLLWPGNTRDKGRYAQLRLKSLVDGQYLQVLDGLPRPGSGGTAPYIYALARRGRRVLTDLGEPVPAYYRPQGRGKVVRWAPDLDGCHREEASARRPAPSSRRGTNRRVALTWAGGEHPNCRSDPQRFLQRLGQGAGQDQRRSSPPF